MSASIALRNRILSALGAGLLLGLTSPAGCAGRNETSGGAGERNVEPLQCSSGTPAVSCWPPGTTHFNSGQTPNPAPLPEPVFDANGCQIVEQVRDGCCNAAASGPDFVQGECCYGFCTGACCGRPLSVNGAWRVAAIELRGDWGAPSGRADAGQLEAGLRQEIVRSWLADAQLEHASIASFARFTLDLLAFGAPADLVQDAARALADEVRHARTCFELAGLYTGRNYGPGCLNVDGVTASASLADAAASAVREGCIGETVAALIARERASDARWAEPRAVLEGIADDEARHAELAWRFVRWAGRVGGPSVRAAIAGAFRALRPPTALQTAADDPLLAAHGCISDARADMLAREAIVEIVEPCARALLAELPTTLEAESSLGA